MKSSSVSLAPRESLPHGLRTIMIKVVDQPYNEGACQCSEIQKDLNTYWTEIFPLLKLTIEYLNDSQKIREKVLRSDGTKIKNLASACPV